MGCSQGEHHFFALLTGVVTEGKSQVQWAVEVKYFVVEEVCFQVLLLSKFEVHFFDKMEEQILQQAKRSP